MKQRIPLEQLSVGMRVIGLDRSWLDTPFFRHRFTITKSDQIQQLKASGVRFVEVEGVGRAPEEDFTTEDVDILLDARHPAAPDGPPVEPPISRLGPTSFQEELNVAREVYREAKKVVQDCFADVRIGVGLKTQAIDKVVSRLADSVLRNVAAAASLSRLKDTDQSAFNHSVNTSVLALALGVSLKIDGDDLHALGVGALLHDIGQVMVPPEVMNKPGRYEPHEYELVKQHPVHGSDLLSKTHGLSQKVVLPALEHHERVDGSGYPYQRKGAEVSLVGQIVGIADVYDTITTDHPYQKASSSHRALQSLYSLARKGTLDQALVERFIRCVGVYPVGSCVRLNSGEIGVVTGNQYDNPLAPRVMLVRDTQGLPIGNPYEVDLAAEERTHLKVTAVIDPLTIGVIPDHYLVGC